MLGYWSICPLSLLSASFWSQKRSRWEVRGQRWGVSLARRNLEIEEIEQQRQGSHLEGVFITSPWIPWLELRHRRHLTERKQSTCLARTNQNGTCESWAVSATCAGHTVPPLVLWSWQTAECNFIHLLAASVVFLRVVLNSKELYHNGWPRLWFIPPSSLLHGGPMHASLFTEGKKIRRLDVVNWRGMDSIFIAIVKLYLLEIIQVRIPTSHLVFDSVDKRVLTCLHLWVNRVQIHYQWIWERFNLGWHGPIEPFLPSPYLCIVNFCSVRMSCVSNF